MNLRSAWNDSETLSQMIKQTRKQYSFLLCVACMCAHEDQRATLGVFLLHSPLDVYDSLFLEPAAHNVAMLASPF